MKYSLSRSQAWKVIGGGVNFERLRGFSLPNQIFFFTCFFLKLEVVIFVKHLKSRNDAPVKFAAGGENVCLETRSHLKTWITCLSH